MTPTEKLNHLKDYISYRTDIISDKPNWWLTTAKNELPSFDYYIKNCVEDKGGKYDFTKRRYTTHATILDKIERVNYQPSKCHQKDVYRTIEYSYWMSSPFNFKEKITTK